MPRMAQFPPRRAMPTPSAGAPATEVRMQPSL
jgi:hypothetical protein